MAELSVFLLEIKKELSLEEEPETSCAMKERPKQNLGIHVFFFFNCAISSCITICWGNHNFDGQNRTFTDKCVADFFL